MNPYGSMVTITNLSSVGYHKALIKTHAAVRKHTCSRDHDSKDMVRTLERLESRQSTSWQFEHENLQNLLLTIYSISSGQQEEKDFLQENAWPTFT